MVNLRKFMFNKKNVIYVYKSYFRVILSSCRKESFGFVRAADFAFLYVLEFATNHLTAHR